MSIKDNPEAYLGQEVRIRRGKGTVKAYLSSVGKGNFFQGTWVGKGGRPQIGMVPFGEIEHLVKIEEKAEKSDDP